MADRVFVRRVNFSQISNFPICDAELSERALGLYTRLFYFGTLPGYSLTKKNMSEKSTLGRDAFNKTWNELINKGYLKVICTRDGGKFSYDYELLDAPEVPDQQRDSYKSKSKNPPCTENPYTVEPCTEKPTTVNQYSNNNTISNNTDILERKVEPPAVVKTELSEETAEDLRTINTFAPHEVGCHEKYDPQKVLKVAKSKDGKQYTGEELAKILNEVHSRYMKVSARGGVGDSWSYFFKIVKSVSGQWETIKTKKTRRTKKPFQKAPNSFHNFHQRDYDYDKLEADILKAQW